MGTTKRLRLAAAGLVIGGTLAVAGTIAEAAPGSKKYVTICHATGDRSNPYEQLKVQRKYADGPSKSARGKRNEDDHYINDKGPLGPTTSGTWGDIIPPMTPKSAKASAAMRGHDGLNWTPAGIAIYDNGCKVVPPAPTTSTTLSMSPTTVASGATTSTTMSPGATTSTTVRTTTTSTTVPPTTSTSVNPPTTSTSVNPPTTSTTQMIL